MKPSLQIKLGQQLTMTPQLQQAIKLLQLSSCDLELEIQEALESNPMLEQLEEQESEKQEQNFKLDDLVNYNQSHKSSSEDIEFDKFHSKELTLQDYLLWQLNLTPFSGIDNTIAVNIIDSISEDGYLTSTLNDIQEAVNSQIDTKTDEKVEIDEVEMVLHRLQQFDPIGVASRDLKECLLLQLKSAPENTPYLAQTRILIENHIELLGQRNYTRIKSRLKLNDADLEAVMLLLTSLNPRPGTIIGKSSSEILIPDVVVIKKQDEYTVELNKENQPKIRINPSYAALVKRADTSRDNKFLQEQLNEAKWFMKSLSNRNETLLKVSNCIIKNQIDFLELGEKAMKPMILQDVAKKLELHESTVSRVTSNKYIHTPRGVYELKFFFSSHLNTKDGDDKSSVAIKALIKDFIAKEESKKPLSDCKIK